MPNYVEKIQPEFQYVPVDVIDVIEGFNPREYFDPTALKDLADSIKSEGVIQPIIIRPNPDKDGRFFLIAGERRYRASQIAEQVDIPVVIRNVSEDQARIIALIENNQREDVTPMEEAIAARKVLDYVNGDRDEASRVLGWSRKMLDNRLLLLHCITDVQSALIQRKILIGHAELFSVLPETTQKGTLKKVLAENWSIQELKKRIVSFTSKRVLASAVFDTSVCMDCKHNTSKQAALFVEHVDAGCCGLPVCWDEKVKVWLEQRKQELATEYTKLYMDVEKDPASWTLLIATGNDGIGKEQYAACKACENYGAIMSTQPGKVGTVVHDNVCFNPGCHKEKVITYRESLGTDEKSNNTTASDSTSSTNGNKRKTGTRTTSKSGSATKPASAITPRKITEHVNGFYRETSAKVIATSPTMITVYTILALQHESEGGDLIDSLKKEFSFLKTSDRSKLITQLFKQGDAVLERIIQTYVTSIAQQKDRFEQSRPYLDGAKTTLKCLKTDLSQHFVIDEAFLQLHTKGGLMDLLKKAKNKEGETFVKVFDAKNGKGSFAKLDKEKHPDMIKKILDSGFDFAGYLPKSVVLK